MRGGTVAEHVVEDLATRGLLSVTRAAEYAHVSPTAIARAIDAGRLPVAETINGCRFVDRRLVAELYATRRPLSAATARGCVAILALVLASCTVATPPTAPAPIAPRHSPGLAPPVIRAAGLRPPVGPVVEIDLPNDCRAYAEALGDGFYGWCPEEEFARAAAAEVCAPYDRSRVYGCFPCGWTYSTLQHPYCAGLR